MICLVTDRRRLVAGAGADAARDCLVAQARHAVDAGVDLDPGARARSRGGALAALVARAASASTRGTPTRVVVNDRLDVALACGADGVHLRGDSMPRRAAARRLAPPRFLIGRSVHSVGRGARSAAPVPTI